MDRARLADKVALVTGAASGIGQATAERLAAEGARVLCADLDEEGARATALAIGRAGGEAASGRCDVADSASCAAGVDAALGRFGRLDALCNVAGVGLYAHATDLADEQWSRVLAVNLSGTFFMCRAALPTCWRAAARSSTWPRPRGWPESRTPRPTARRRAAWCC
jgi:NAD(P)-dependent dehydrogenase (short-subunit alcohol dehydrogenase family)